MDKQTWGYDLNANNHIEHLSYTLIRKHGITAVIKHSLEI